jgi:CheY-like chemotaxis protein
MAHILVVDDYPAILALLDLTLTVEGHEVATAGDGAAGLELAARLKPDLVLLDVDMPGMGGMAMCGDLKRDPATAHIPVLMMTGRLCLEVLVKARQVGALGVLPKPFIRVHLLEEVAQAVRAVQPTR